GLRLPQQLRGPTLEVAEELLGRVLGEVLAEPSPDVLWIRQGRYLIGQHVTTVVYNVPIGTVRAGAVPAVVRRAETTERVSQVGWRSAAARRPRTNSTAAGSPSSPRTWSRRLPTITPSHPGTSSPGTRPASRRTCSGAEMPKPTQSGSSVWGRT